MSNASHQIPYQVQSMLDGLLNKKDNVHVRSNYRMRLDTIRREIDDAIRSYDNEVAVKDNRRKA
jgi:hypothetical protein